MRATWADMIGDAAKRFRQHPDIRLQCGAAILPPTPAMTPALQEEAPMAQVEPDVLVFVALIGALLLLV